MAPTFQNLLQKRLAEKRPLIQVLLGPRQVGKTTAAREIHDAFVGSKLFVSADGPIPPNHEWLETHWLRARSLPPPTLFVLDEIQKIDGWSEIVKKEFDRDRGKLDIRVLLLGSSSLSLQRGLTESLAGRFELTRAHHWSFGEMEKQYGWNLDTYLAYGGYPGAARFAEEPERWQSYIRDAIVEPVLGRDIPTGRAITKPALFRQTFEVILNYPAQQISYQKIVGQLQERGTGETIKHYLQLYEGAFLVGSVMQFSTRPLTTRTSSPKILPFAPALCHAFVSPKRIEIDPEWRGRIFEAVVGAALARQERELFTWREGQYEIDYVVPRPDGLVAIEVKSGRNRGTSGLHRFLGNFPKARTLILTAESALPLLRGEPLDSLVK